MKKKWEAEEKKQVWIFLAVAFGVPYLLGILMGVQYFKGNGVSVFPNAQMYYPAAGVMLAMFITRKGDALLPKKFYIWYLLNTAAMIGLCFVSLFSSDAAMAGSLNSAIILGSLLGWLFLYWTKKKSGRPMD